MGSAHPTFAPAGMRHSSRQGSPPRARWPTQDITPSSSSAPSHRQCCGPCARALAGTKTAPATAAYPRPRSVPILQHQRAAGPGLLTAFLYAALMLDGAILRRVTALEWSSSSSSLHQLVAGHEDGSLRCYDARAGACLRTHKKKGAEISAITVLDRCGDCAIVAAIFPGTHTAQGFAATDPGPGATDD